MNTLLNLLSAAAVVATGAFASTPPRDAEVRTPPTPAPVFLNATTLVPRTAQQSPVFQSSGPWLTISEDRRAEDAASQDAPIQRWIF